MLTRATYVTLLAGASATLGFMAYAGAEPAGLAWWLSLLPFAAWALLPYALLAAAAHRRPANLASRSVVCAAAALLSGFSILVLYSAFVTHLDPQSAVVFVFLPLWQLIGLLPLLVVSRLLARRGAAGTRAGAVG